jgi:SSS family solute:Na+ symporter
MSQSVLEAALSIASIPLGALLGVFLLGVLTKRATENHAIAGMLIGLSVITYIWLGTKTAWTWYAVAGAVTTFLTGLAASYVVPTRRETSA